jgi:putative membrane protein
MTRSLFLSLVCTGALLCIQPASTAFAQRTGGATTGQNPSTPGTLPSQNNPGQTPGVNGPAGANSPDTMTAKVDDKKFVKDAALGGLTEVELGKLAAQKASRDDVKQFAQNMVDDHTKANDELKQVASKENIPVPEALDSKHQSRVDKLSKLSGEAFDKAYVKDQLKDHEADVREFNAEAQNGTDPNVKAFASSTLPTLQHHLDMVKDLNRVEKNAAKQNKGE